MVVGSENHVVNIRVHVFTSHSLTNTIRTRSTGCLFAPSIILFFDGRQPIGKRIFRLTPKSTPVELKISEGIGGVRARRRLADRLFAFQKTRTQQWLPLCPQKRVGIIFVRLATYKTVYAVGGRI